MKQKYFYHEHLADYAMMKTKGMMSRDELYGYLDFSDFSSKSFLTETLPRLDVKAGARVLELGCGTGSGACFLAELGYQVHGIDVIPDAIDCRPSAIMGHTEGVEKPERCGVGSAPWMR